MEQVKRIDLGEINASLCIGASVEIEAVIEQNKGGTTVNKQYVSDLIGEDVIGTWEPGQIIMIISGTDTGKSHFIRNRVYEHFKSQGKKVLYLVSRSILKQQFMLPMADETNIAFMTYQAVEEIQSNPNRNLGEWDVVDLYVHNYSNNQIGGNLRSLKRDNGKVALLNNEGQEAYNSAHGRGNDGSGIIFDKPIQVDGKTYFVKAVNKLKHTYTTQMIETYQTILQKGVGYIRYVADLLDIKEYSVMEDTQHSKNLAEYLESMVGRPMLTKKDRERFVERVNVTIDGKRRKEYISISGCIEGSGLPYRLIRYRKKPYRIWEIVKIPR